MADNVIPLRPVRPCPICGQNSSQAFHPFCSGRCADIDLNRWLTGSYVIPAGTGEDDGGDDAPGLPAPEDDDI
ncbi:DNA gyrase inhibitor YacG [Arsenicitalea aurantiaca]|uniref:DNA gyrase inhibitor YacG n=1 Tax=Arsenicitalea aurantiaca TaxID=1783274 RepID=A0A433XB54_9HYPH|nr:DNA gyrase inhibitor YacG [Arsenicitalea aurantiaca]RUT31305.1 DNA gyrase inhibitor YacG [Arsenicitalea aurantiaca]